MYANIVYVSEQLMMLLLTMPIVIKQLEEYLRETLGVTVTLMPWQAVGRLAPFLVNRYDFRETRLMDVRCLVMLDASIQEQPAATIRKHIAQVQAKWQGEVVYVRAQITAYNRRRLIEHRIPFVVPGNQMYLPMLGTYLREHFRKPRVKPAHFSPATQALVIHWLLGPADRTFTPAQAAKTLGYSAMTMTRAFNELETAGLGEITRQGKERRLRFAGPKRDIWDRAQPMLRSPVTKRLYVRPPAPPAGVRAGLEALAHYTMLSPPGHRVFAVFGQDQGSLDHWHNKPSIPPGDPEAVEVEVWCYDPRPFAQERVVDRLSLYLSLKDTKDERVEAALDEMIGSKQW